RVFRTRLVRAYRTRCSGDLVVRPVAKTAAQLVDSRGFRNLGGKERQISIMDLTHNLGIPVVAAVTCAKDGGNLSRVSVPLFAWARRHMLRSASWCGSS